jgi:hypothetical protein
LLDALLASTNSDLGILGSAVSCFARLRGCHDRLAANEFEDELAAVDQMGGVEVRELSHPLGQDSNEGLERLTGEELIEHVEG